MIVELVVKFLYLDPLISGQFLKFKCTLLPDVKPDQQGTSLTKRKTRRKEGGAEKNGHKPGSSPPRGSDNSDGDVNGEANDHVSAKAFNFRADL